MLLFSTVLRIDPNKMRKPQDFFDLINEWNDTNTRFEGNRIPDLNWQGESNFKWGSDKLWLAAEVYEKESTYAVRYQKHQDNGAVWDTDYVMNFRNMKMSVRLERSYTQDAMPKSKDFSSPYFIKHLIDKEYLKKDNDLPLLREPIVIEDGMVNILGGIITGKTHYNYPVVYVSKNPSNEDPVDVDKLAWKLMGVAHVLVEKDYNQNSAIRTACENLHEYNGNIGIYYPNQTFAHSRLNYRQSRGKDPILYDSVLREISQYCNSMLVDTKLTWQGVNNVLLLDRSISQSETIKNIEVALKNTEAAKQALDDNLTEERKKLAEEAVKAAEEEMNSLLEEAAQAEAEFRTKIAELTKENQDLKAENAILYHATLKVEGVPIIVVGKEKEFYPGEIKDLILLTLEEKVQEIKKEHSRRRDVLQDIIENNNYERISESRYEDLVKGMKGYRTFSDEKQSVMRRLGFDIKRDGPHFKCTYYDDKRYVKGMSCTASDVNTCNSICSEIKDLIY